MKKLLFVISLLVAFPSLGQVGRIQATRFDRSQVMRIYLAPGLGSLVLFPCALIEVFVGRGEDLKAQISPSDKKTLFLNLKLNSSLPTNMIAKCEPERNVFVFDVIPSKTQHQDLVDIRNAFGGPVIQGAKAIDPKPKNKVVLRAPVLMKAGASK